MGAMLGGAKCDADDDDDGASNMGSNWQDGDAGVKEEDAGSAGMT